MAFALVNADRGHGNSGTGSSSFGFSPSANLAAGDLVILVVGTSLADVVSSVSDNSGGGNSWQVDVTEQVGADAVSVCSCVLAGGVTTAQTITVTMGSILTVAAQYWLAEFSGAALSAWLDVTAIGAGAATTALTTNTSAGLAGSTELAIGAFHVTGGATFTAGTGFTALGTQGATFAEYQILASSAGLPATATASVNSTYVGALATYKIPAAGSPHVATAPARKRRPPRPRKRRTGPAVDAFATLYRGLVIPTGTQQASADRRKRRAIPQRHRTRLAQSFSARMAAASPPAGSVESRVRRRPRPVAPPNRRHHVASRVDEAALSLTPTLPLLGVGP